MLCIYASMIYGATFKKPLACTGSPTGTGKAPDETKWLLGMLSLLQYYPSAVSAWAPLSRSRTCYQPGLWRPIRILTPKRIPRYTVMASSYCDLPDAPYVASHTFATPGVRKVGCRWLHRSIVLSNRSVFIAVNLVHFLGTSLRICNAVK